MIESVKRALISRWSLDFGESFVENSKTIPSILLSRRDISDLAELLQVVSLWGAGGPGIDNQGFRFWPAAEVCDISQFENGRYSFSGLKKYYVFSDYLDFSWGYATPLHEDGDVLLLGHASGKEMKIADSLSEFIEYYLADDDRIYSFEK